MNPHSFTEALRLKLDAAFSGLSIHTAVMDGSRSLPYVLLTLSSGEERILRNHTWDCELSVQLLTHAQDTNGEEARNRFASLCAEVEKGSLRDLLNESASDFYLYRLSLQVVDEPMVQDDSFIQSARFRVLIQF